MVKTMLFILLVLMPHVASAEMCNSPLDPSTWTNTEAKLKEPHVHIIPHPTLGGNAIVVGWMTVTPGKICCNVSHFDPGSWDNILTGARTEEPVPVTTFAVSLPPLPWAARAMDHPWAVAACERMANKVVAAVNAAPVVTPPPAVPAVYIIVVPNSGQTSRPLYDERILVSASAPAIGRVEILLNGAPRICEPAASMRPGSSTKYYWVTNSANPPQRGLAVCKPAT